MKKVIITFNPDGVVTWEAMPEESGFNPEKQPGILAMASECFQTVGRKPRIKPHQFDKEYRVECTPKQREEIIRVALELGRSVYGDTSEQGEYFKNLFWSTDDGVVGSCATQENDPTFNWIPFPEFLARLKGEWEPAQEKPEPDYSHLVGKWVRYCLKGKEEEPFFGKWMRIKSFRYLPSDEVTPWITTYSGFNFNIYENEWFKGEDYCIDFHERCFDLTDPRDSNPDEPIETVIPFDYTRWKAGDFVRVVNGRGEEVTQLTEFDCTNDFPLIGVSKSKWASYRKSGSFFTNNSSANSLRLVVLQTPQA